ncbi:hypothetical protein [Nocardioides sp.]|uniref:hypothetical protein n=1 Tax=Nocardioides sp. TaxID=35761 RepID=UPI002716E3E6|nr:hypothetical protein [Nocardioides sp.]MDO9456400.1 hypothetical protein [Nocardioides sp.]
MSTLLTERSKSGVAAVLAVAVCLLAAACGSNLDPEQVADTQRQEGAAPAAGGAASAVF